MNSSAAALLGTGTPNGARMYDYLLGGKDNFPADREHADRIAALYPPGVPGPAELAIANRVYLQRAVSQSVHSRARQVLDLGSGLPAPHLGLPGAPPLRPLHEEAKDAYREARCVYVDRDDLVFSHGQAEADGVPGVTYVQRDLADVPSVTAAVTEAGIDWRFPVTVVFGLVLHSCPAGEAGRIVKGYLERLRPGSLVVITVACWESGLLEKVRGACAPQPLYSHGPTQVMELFRGMSLLGNGIEIARGRPESVGRQVRACVLGGVGKV